MLYLTNIPFSLPRISTKLLQIYRCTHLTLVLEAQIDINATAADHFVDPLLTLDLLATGRSRSGDLGNGDTSIFVHPRLRGGTARLAFLLLAVTLFSARLASVTELDYTTVTFVLHLVASVDGFRSQNDATPVSEVLHQAEVSNYVDSATVAGNPE